MTVHRSLVLTAIFMSLCLLFWTDSVEAGFQETLREALRLHEEASDLDEERAALAAFEAVVEKHPDAWLPCFWASYLQTQVGRLVPPAEVDPHLDRAQELLTRARELSSASASPRDQAAIEALQALIYSFLAIRSGDHAQYAPLEGKAMVSAIRLDGDSPVVLTMIAVESIRRGQAEGDLSQVLSGKILLERAEELFGATLDRSSSTDMNSEWVPFWLGMAEKALSKEN